ncbi:hypothetical protein HN51_046413 [Arachis hypogaea]
MKEVGVEAVQDNVVWLKRSIVGSATREIDFSSLNDFVRTAWPNVVRICDMGRYKALLTFENDRSAEEAVEYFGSEIQGIFHHVCRWHEQIRCDRRRVWLKCHGVPLHAWTAATFSAIGAQWGEVIAVDDDTRLATSFWAGSVLIDTWRFDPISEGLRLTVGSCGFDVYVTEKEMNGSGALGGMMHSGLKRGTTYDATPPGSSHPPGKLVDCVIPAEVVALPFRAEKVQEDSTIIQPEILDEWGNNFLNLKNVTAKCAESSPRMEMVDRALDMVVHDTVLDVGGCISEVQGGEQVDGSNRMDSRIGAQPGLKKMGEGRVASITQGPIVETLGEKGLGHTTGLPLDQNCDKGIGCLRSGRVGGHMVLEPARAASGVDLDRDGKLGVRRGPENGAPRGPPRKPNQCGTESRPVVSEGLNVVADLVAGDMPPTRARPGEGEAWVASRGVLPSVLDRKAREVEAGLEQVGRRKPNGEGGSGGARVRRSLAMDAGLMVLSGGGAELTVVSGEPADGRQKERYGVGQQERVVGRCRVPEAP